MPRRADVSAERRQESRVAAERDNSSRSSARSDDIDGEADGTVSSASDMSDDAWSIAALCCPPLPYAAAAAERRWRRRSGSTVSSVRNAGPYATTAEYVGISPAMFAFSHPVCHAACTEKDTR